MSEVALPNPNVVAEVAGALETPWVGLIPDPSLAPEDNIHPIPNASNSDPSQVGIFAGSSIPSVLFAGGVSAQLLR